MRNISIPHLLRVMAAAAMLWTGVTACDSEPTPDDVERSLPCNLADEECAALPAAAEAIVLLESLDVDADEADVELVEDVFAVEGAEPADLPGSIDDLTSEAPPPEEQRWTCNGGGSVMCCCFWDGPEWGCYCN